MDLDNFVSLTAKDVNEVLQERISPRENDENLLEILRGGKRLRPALSVLSFRACGGRDKNYPKAILGAASIELAHCVSLCHDDILDNEMIRRKKPALWIRDGVPETLLTGHEGLVLALQMAMELGEEISSLFLESWNRCLRGAMQEVEHREIGNISSLDYYKMITLKTASLFSAACKGGTIVASASPKLVEILGDYGLAIGKSYQLADDLVDGKAKERGYPSQRFLMRKMEKNISKAEKLACDDLIPNTDFFPLLKRAPREIVNRKLKSK
ncbi:hypothetical protein AKJ45_00785 [candidate division MSBL1 archaeon SCGC-AAA261F19]|uniref:Polyprenyl synthetase family protein n=1 Tax=candidate division MSBL1 archaeon SCGC-AAA261F19 TaxID=1698275 RepID=A0A133VB70_9EURY|nr:hypothetical protein AKJ45_00785 [candidate division MSBL1 archaeon SCGC-AAA261F19]